MNKILPNEITCPKCGNPIIEAYHNTHRLESCIYCGQKNMVFAFPALHKSTNQTATSNPIDEGDAACFFHPQKKAVIPCETCGRFLCGLCDINFNGKHVCAACLESAKSKKKDVSLETTRTRYDNILISLAILPAFFVFPTVITGPLTLILGIYWWKRPRGLINKGTFSYFLALFLATLQCLVWLSILAAHFYKLNGHKI